MADRALGNSLGFIQVFIITSLTAVAGLLTLTLALSVTVARDGTALSLTIVGRTVVDTTFSRVSEAFALGQGKLEPTEASISGERTSVVIEADGGKISVLAAPVEIIASYADSAGLGSGERDALLAELQALRGHRDGPNALTALEFALGSSVSHEQIQRDFSAHTQFNSIDPAVASETVLAAIPDLSDMERAEILAARARGEPPPFGLSAYLGNPQPYYSLVVTVHWSETEQYVRRIPFELTTGGRIHQLAAPSP